MLTKVHTPKIALIHDWLVNYRGGERVLEAIAELFPGATIFTLFHAPGKYGERLASYPVRASFLNRIPGARRYYRYLLPLFPLAVESFDLSEFDLVISSSHCVAKGVLVPPGIPHLCYCHTPMRYAWDRSRDYFPGKWMQAIVSPFLHYLRQWDVTSSHRVDHFMVNSRWVGQRLWRFHRRDSVVLYPFVDLDRLPFKTRPGGDYYLIVSAFAPYKRIDLAIQACNQLGVPLKIVGNGQQDRYLRRLAGPHTEFLGQVSGPEIGELYVNAKAFLFPGEEDFGIAPVEAMACGTPVIAFGKGGATESVVENKTGLFFYEPTVESLVDAIRAFELRSDAFTPEECRLRAASFSKENFKKGFMSFLTQALSEAPRRWEIHQEVE
jgi:glycosyltransferase involved in cell wall biosynthesis